MNRTSGRPADYHCFFSPDGQTVSFVFDPRRFSPADRKVARTSLIYISGTFNEWMPEPEERWRLRPRTVGAESLLLRLRLPFAPLTNPVLVRSVPAAPLRVPGNSGQPEFMFLAVTRDGRRVELVPRERTEGRYLLRNNLVFFPDDGADAPIRTANHARRAARIKGLGDFDLSTSEGRMAISNFRPVPASSCLFRSYHPYKKSFLQYETEETRSRIVNELMVSHGISSVICLCGDEPLDESSGERISAYQRELIAAGNQLYTDTSYEQAYFASAGPAFGAVFAGIVRFINARPGPYLVHCRLGSDRTGVVSGLLSLLAGASWDAVAEDYEKTANMGIGEVRDRRLLRYSIDRIASSGSGRPGSPLRDAIVGHFTEGGYLSVSEIEEVSRRLGR